MPVEKVVITWQRWLFCVCSVIVFPLAIILTLTANLSVDNKVVSGTAKDDIYKSIVVPDVIGFGAAELSAINVKVLPLYLYKLK